MVEQRQQKDENRPENKSPDVREPSNVRPTDRPTPDETPRREGKEARAEEEEAE